MTYEEDYSYHVFMYGDLFKNILNTFIENHPNVERPITLVRVMSRSSMVTGTDAGEVGKKAHSFYLRWGDDPRCMSEKTKMFVSLFEEN